MKKRNGLGLTALVLVVVFLPFGCASSKMAKQKEALVEVHKAYRLFCSKIRLRALTQRAFSDLVSELDMYGFIQIRIVSQGRYGRRNEITINLPKELSDRLKKVVLIEFDLDGAL